MCERQDEMRREGHEIDLHARAMVASRGARPQEYDQIRHRGSRGSTSEDRAGCGQSVSRPPCGGSGSQSRSAWERAGNPRQAMRGKEEDGGPGQAPTSRAAAQVRPGPVQVQLSRQIPPHHAPPHDAGPSQDNSHHHHRPAVQAGRQSMSAAGQAIQRRDSARG